MSFGKMTFKKDGKTLDYTVAAVLDTFTFYKHETLRHEPVDPDYDDRYLDRMEAELDRDVERIMRERARAQGDKRRAESDAGVHTAYHAHEHYDRMKAVQREAESLAEWEDAPTVPAGANVQHVAGYIPITTNGGYVTRDDLRRAGLNPAVDKPELFVPLDVANVAKVAKVFGVPARLLTSTELPDKAVPVCPKHGPTKAGLCRRCQR